MVWAAASTTNALQEVNRAFRAASGIEVVTSFAASSTLARQIERGAPADVFVSANTLWMDYLEKRGLLAPGTRRRVARNRLVLIAPGPGRRRRWSSAAAATWPVSWAGAGWPWATRPTCRPASTASRRS